jgi:RND superfamily putative drug exporter
VEASSPILLFCSLFGLSMDYEVFLLSRIQEAFWQTGDNTRSVALGLQRSGGIITSAAVIVIVVSACFATADMILVKALGLGMALAVVIDATLVRGLLVPATMRLLGDWNWWLPFVGVQRRPPALAEYMGKMESEKDATIDEEATDMQIGGKR